MADTLKWQSRGQVFEDGSSLTDWKKIESSPWHPQIESHELTFDIYEHDGHFWKLYRARWIPEGTTRPRSRRLVRRILGALLAGGHVELQPVGPRR